jgi:hypothetical protein
LATGAIADIHINLSQIFTKNFSMKISKEDFESMKAKYDKEVKKGKPAKDKENKDKIDQTNWIFFDRETLEGLLAKADKDPKKGGIQFYITEYTEEVAKKYHPNDVDKLTGALTLVMRSANLENELLSASEDEDVYENIGRICPPHCDPQP